jgi:sortase (surface protein transpeptidase)
MRWNIQRRLKRGNYLGIFFLVVAVGLFVSGGVSIVRGLSAQREVAETQNLGDIPKPNTQPTPGFYMEYAAPVTLRIPSIDVTSNLTTVGKAPDGTIDAPKAPDFDKAAWYRHSPAPGQYGASVIVGHVDSYASGNGASVFYNLAKLKPGDTVTVERADKTTAVFRIYATRQYDRKKIPTEQVYNANSPNAELRLITCSGNFDEKTDEYTSNTVIFAALVDTKKAS